MLDKIMSYFTKTLCYFCQMWPSDDRTSMIIENTEQEIICVNLWREQQNICKHIGK